MPFQLPPLPYGTGDLAPYISENTLNIHHGKHHNAYVQNLNGLIAGTDLESKSLEDIIVAAKNDPAKAPIFNNAAQIWNHTFYWHSMAPNGGGKPTGDVAHKIDVDFGSFDAFRDAFKQAALGQFGSGWAWLVLDNGTLKITKTSNGDLPMAHGHDALLTCDVWEHAYYLDYQNKRADYVDTFLDHLVNWSFATENLKLARR
jgi:Fe-Mn family superoxide dismutase